MRRENVGRLTIGEVAQEAGVATTTLRCYEREGLLRPTDRSRAIRSWTTHKRSTPWPSDQLTNRAAVLVGTAWSKFRGVVSQPYTSHQ